MLIFCGMRFVVPVTKCKCIFDVIIDEVMVSVMKEGHTLYTYVYFTVIKASDPFFQRNRNNLDQNSTA